MNFESLQAQVIEPGLCTRCGICAGACPTGVIEIGKKRYPELTGDCIDCGFCVQSCPGGDVDFPLLNEQVFQKEYDPEDLLGEVEEFLVGHSSNKKIRELGTSGGLVTGLLIYLLENNVIDGAVVAGYNPEDPCTMKGVLATTPEEVLDAAQSKYCVTSSMEALQAVRRKKGKYAVVGLPCQIQGLRKLMQIDSALAQKIYCVFGLYCHCNMEPDILGDILENQGIKQDDISRFDFRGGGWPGGFHVLDKDGQGTSLHKTLYTTNVNILFKFYAAHRCHLCIDALSEYADISFGDFWAGDYTGEFAELERCTLVSQRTERGREIIDKAVADNGITMHQLPEERYSKRILSMVRGKKGLSLARIRMLRKKGEPTPDYHFPVPSPNIIARYYEWLLRLSLFLCRGERSRKLVLKFLFSPSAIAFEKVNLVRKKIFCDYSGN